MKRITLTKRQHRILSHFLAEHLNQNFKQHEPKKMWTSSVYRHELNQCYVAMLTGEKLSTSSNWIKDDCADIFEEN
jgi:hypothetical protein